MVNVLFIGKYEEAGQFNTNQWKCFIEWCKRECNRIIVYSQMSYNIIKTKFSHYCNIYELEKPDEVLNVYAYEINVTNMMFWNYIKEYSYNINQANDISHIYFFKKEKYVASLEIVDYENYILIEEPIKQKDIFLLKEELANENYRFCLEGEADINELLQEESWKPLGYN